MQEHQQANCSSPHSQCFSPIQQPPINNDRPQTPQYSQVVYQQQPPMQQQQPFVGDSSRPQTPQYTQGYQQNPQQYIPPQQQQQHQQQPYPQYGLYPQVQPLNTQQFDQTMNKANTIQQQGYPQQHQQQPMMGYVQPQYSYVQQPQQYTQQQYIPPQQPYQQPPQQYIPPQQQQPVQPTFVQTTTVTEKTFMPGSTTPTIVQQTVTTTKVPPPIKGSMMQSVKLQVIEQAAKQWFKKRMELIEILESMISSLNKKQQSSAKTKFGGTVSNIVGASLIVGGVVAAPFTMGGSLLATGAGLTAIAGGTTATVAASVSEWKHAKKTAKIAQELLQSDTQAVNDIIAKIYDYRNIDPMVETRTILISNIAVNIVIFVNALIGSRIQVLDQTGGLTNDNTGAASLASLMVKGVVPIVSIPVDMLVLVNESKKANGKEPAKLALKIQPVLESLKIQTRNATGMTIL